MLVRLGIRFLIRTLEKSFKVIRLVMSFMLNACDEGYSNEVAVYI